MLALLASAALATGALAAPPWACPAGRQAMQVVDEVGTWQLCQRPDGARDGPAEQRRFDGSLAASGAFRDGARHGPWTLRDAAGRVSEVGAFEAGRRAGAWSTLDAAGAIVATVTWWELAEAATARQDPKDRRQAWARALRGPAASLAPLGDALLVEHGGTWTAIDVAEGAERWSVALPAGLRPGVVATADAVAAVTGPGEVLVVEPGAGRVRRIRTELGATEVVSLTDGAVVVREGAGRLEALDPTTGRSLWRTRRAAGPVAPVQAGADRVAVALGRSVRAVSTAAPDDTLWQAQLDAPVARLAAAWGGDRVYALDEQGGLVALRAATGEPLWSTPIAPARGKAAGATLRDDAHALVVATGDALLSLDRRGRVLASDPLPKEAAMGGDLLDDARCYATRTGTLRCGSARQHTVDWALELGVHAQAPVVLGDRVVSALADGRLVAIDPAVAALSADGVPAGAVVLDPALPLLLDPVLGDFGLEGVPATAPLLELARVDGEADCPVYEAVIDLGQATLEDTGEPLDAADRHGLAVPALEVAETSLDAPAVLDDETWAITDRGARWSLAYWHQWRPWVEALVPMGAAAEDAPRVARLLQCDGPAARFEGRAVLHEGHATRHVAGRIGVTPLPHILDGVPGCLLQLTLAGEDLGTFASPTLPGWVELRLTFEGDAADRPLDLPPVGRAGFPAGPHAGTVWVDALPEGAAQREEWEADGTLWLERSWAATPTEAADPADLLVQDEVGEVLRLQADDLLYGEVGEGADGVERPVVDWTTWHTLEARAPVSAAESRFVPVWTARTCPRVPAPDAPGAAAPRPETP